MSPHHTDAIERNQPALQVTKKVSNEAGSNALSNAIVATMLFILSVATLSLEVVLIRIFSYSLSPALVYMTISMALLGFGVSGTVLAIFPRLRQIDLIKSLVICLLFFAGSTLVANAIFSRLSQSVARESGFSWVSPVVPLLLLFFIPFFFAGLGIALVFVSNARQIGRNYCVNLLGSAAGCFIIYPILQTLGAERLVLAIAFICTMSASVAALLRVRTWLPVASALSLILLLCCVFPSYVLSYQPDPMDLLATATERVDAEKDPAQPSAREIFYGWDPVGRIDLVRFEGRFGLFAGRAPAIFFAQDAGAGSVVLGLKNQDALAQSFAKATLYGLASSLRVGAEMVVIGIGGGPDIIASLTAGAGRLTGVEVNHTVIDAIGGRYRDLIGLPPLDSGRLRLVHGDGRAYVRQYSDRFDVIQMTGADTYASSAGSGSMLSENHLYTVEAMSDYFRALKPDGILAITRFGMEAFRTLTTAIAGLRKSGIEQPLRHIVVVQQSPVWIASLIKKTPFTTEEIERVLDRCKQSHGIATRLSLPIYDLIGYRFDMPMHPIFYPNMPMQDREKIRALAPFYQSFYALITAAQNRTVDRWLSNQTNDYSAPTDDRPFFFHFPRVSWPTMAELFRARTTSGRFIWDVKQYIVMVFQIAVLTLLLVIAPLSILKRRGLSVKSAPPLGLFFFAIGVGFMLMEIGLMQKLSLFLGHPNHAISTVLFSMLLFSGIGSYVSHRIALSVRTVIRLAAVVVVSLAIGFSFAPTGIIDFAMPVNIALRVAMAATLLALPSFFLGMFFPVMLSRTEKTLPGFTPWAFGVNGFASVIGSLAAIPLSVALGFSATLLISAGAYLVAWLTVEAPLSREWKTVTREIDSK